MTKQPELKPLTIKQADAEGRIRETTVMVTPAIRERLPLPFSKKMKERQRLQTQVGVLINAAFTHRIERLKATQVSAGEAEIVAKGIDSDRANYVESMRHKSLRTLQVLLATFNESEESLLILEKVLEDTNFRDECFIREAMVFSDDTQGSYFTYVRPLIDNLKTCHPFLAMEDLSELDGTVFNFARKLLRISISLQDEERNKRQKNSPSGEFSVALGQARAEIIRHTPYMTPALATVVMECPEKLPLVLEALKSRGIAVAQADTLIEEIVSTSTPLSTGAL